MRYSSFSQPVFQGNLEFLWQAPGSRVLSSLDWLDSCFLYAIFIRTSIFQSNYPIPPPPLLLTQFSSALNLKFRFSLSNFLLVFWCFISPCKKWQFLQSEEDIEETFYCAYLVDRPKIIVFALRKESVMEIVSPPTGMLESFSIVSFFQNDDVMNRK